ncbi:Nucleoporin NUP53 [Gracilariopsis chorda]|uniref:Nucleoporin NUP53 n=1 Tax=Gracilariopsis chorda TaxID=448386 RepID=A0A2V3IX46_9FLOR|nr:Nucleoporin NUP53 [Gracilariopsis chorda]|eukprot:PXF46712.1 Nucleoporin NUP53 [Gracilariopsis chorda]
MFPSPSNARDDDHTTERLPNYLLSSSATPALDQPSSHLFQTPAKYTPQRRLSTRPEAPQLFARRTPLTFNDRLRPDRPDDHSTASRTFMPSTKPRTPHVPPNKSLLDTGPPSVRVLRSPSASPATSLTPNSLSARTPTLGPQDRWITVFGFGPAMEAQALREFRRHGEIVRTMPGKGNWVHILYRTPLQAQVALQRPWRILAGTETMVGAMPCTEPNVAKLADEQIEKGMLIASPSVATSAPFGTPAPPPSATPINSLKTPSTMLRREPATVSEPTVIRTPQRQSGIFDFFSGFYK